MAKDNKTNNAKDAVNTSPAQQGSENKKGNPMGNIIFGLLAFVTAISIILAVVGGAYYFVIHNNMNGLADKYRKDIQNWPVLKLALPVPPDPEDPKYLTQNDILKGYQNLRKKRDELTKQLNEANKKLKELEGVKTENDKVKSDNEKIKNDTKAQQDDIDKQKKQLEDEKKKLNELIASGNKDGFKSYFEQVDKDTAQKIYTQIMQEQKTSADTKKFIQTYEAMDPSAAAKIFEQLGTSKIDLVVDIIKNMKKDTSSQILAAMDPAYASKVTDRLSKIIKGASPSPSPTQTPAS